MQRVTDVDEVQLRMRRDAMVAREAAAAPFSEEGLFEYHLYAMSRPTDLKQNEQKQVVLLEGRGFDIHKELVFRGEPRLYRSAYGDTGRNQKARVFLNFQNSEQEGLGMPLPRGVVRVYKADVSGAQQFVGEDRIDRTPRAPRAPRDERVSLQIGQAFGVVVEAQKGSVVEPVGGDWTLVSASATHAVLDAFTFRFRPTIPAHGEVSLRYRVRWC